MEEAGPGQVRADPGRAGAWPYIKLSRGPTGGDDSRSSLAQRGYVDLAKATELSPGSHLGSCSNVLPSPPQLPPSPRGREEEAVGVYAESLG